MLPFGRDPMRRGVEVVSTGRAGRIGDGWCDDERDVVGGGAGPEHERVAAGRAEWG